MSGLNFGSTIQTLTEALQGANATHSALANNVANVNTPNFRRTDVSFKESLIAQDPDPDANADDLQLEVSDARHIDPNNASLTPPPFEISTKVDDSSRMRADGSNVDMDQEMAKLSINSGYAEMMNTLLTTQYTRLREGISEQA
jgi:flagellar basal-body rod protein FlgB